MCDELSLCKTTATVTVECRDDNNVFWLTLVTPLPVRAFTSSTINESVIIVAPVQNVLGLPRLRNYISLAPLGNLMGYILQ